MQPRGEPIIALIRLGGVEAAFRLVHDLVERFEADHAAEVGVLGQIVDVDVGPVAAAERLLQPRSDRRGERFQDERPVVLLGCHVSMIGLGFESGRAARSAVTAAHEFAAAGEGLQSPPEHFARVDDFARDGLGAGRERGAAGVRPPFARTQPQGFVLG